MMSKNGTQVFLAYETGHVPLVRSWMATATQPRVIALDYEVELDLKKQNIPFESLRDVAKSPEGDREPIEFTRALARQWYTSPELSFFQYDEILLGEQHEPTLLYYFQTLLYFLLMLEQVFSNDTLPAKIFVPESFAHIPKTADVTARFKENLPVAVTELLAERIGVPVEVLRAPVSHMARGRIKALRHGVVQFLARLMVRISNLFVTLFTTPRPIRLFVSDPWSRIEPFIQNMHDVELIMTRRKEMKVMKSFVWKTRTRFHHRFDFSNKVTERVIRASVARFRTQWDVVTQRPEIRQLFEYKGISFWSIAQPVLEAIVTEDSKSAIRAIESTKHVFRKYNINCVLLFASVKGYNNVVARIAERMNIPSIELQHALEYAEKTYTFSRLNAKYLAAYGKLTQEKFKRFGVEPERVVECGSPRFDAYAQPVLKKDIENMEVELKLDQTRTRALVVAPSIYLSLEHQGLTSYAAQEILEDLSGVLQNTPDLFFIFKMRPWPFREKFYRREETQKLFAPRAVTVQYEDLRVLLALSDIVVSNSSTIVLESMLMHKPVVLYLPRRIDKDFQEYEDAHAVLMARTKEELHTHVQNLLTNPQEREALVARANEFVRRNYCMDGRSADRITKLIRNVSLSRRI